MLGTAQRNLTGYPHEQSRIWIKWCGLPSTRRSGRRTVPQRGSGLNKLAVKLDLLYKASSFSSLLKRLTQYVGSPTLQYIHDKGEIMEYIKQIRMQRYMNTAAYRMELYNNALYACGEALF